MQNSFNREIVRCRQNYYEEWAENKSEYISNMKMQYAELCQVLNVDSCQVNQLLQPFEKKTHLHQITILYVSIIAFVKKSCLRYICKYVTKKGLRICRRDIIQCLFENGFEFPSSLQDYASHCEELFQINLDRFQEEIQKYEKIDTTTTNGLILDGILCAILHKMGITIKVLANEFRMSEMTIRNTYEKLYESQEEEKNEHSKEKSNKIGQDYTISEETLPCHIKNKISKLNPAAKKAALLWYEDQTRTAKDIDGMLPTASLPTIRKAIKTIRG